jgi:hypothetical protein
MKATSTTNDVIELRVFRVQSLSSEFHSIAYSEEYSLLSCDVL